MLKRLSGALFALTAIGLFLGAPAIAGPGATHVVCDSGCSGGAGGTVNQGTPNAGGATNSWPVQGAGMAGTPAGGVVSVQGVSSGVSVSTTSVPSSSSTAGIAPVATSALASNQVAKGSAGNLYGFSGNSTAAGYWMVFNLTSAPSDGAVTPVYCYAYPVANQPFGASWGNYPAVMSTGITIVFSTTGCFTKTASATAFISSQVQ